jgi:hypothetical protein
MIKFDSRRGTNFSGDSVVQTGPVSHPVLYTMYIASTVLGGKAAGAGI